MYGKIVQSHFRYGAQLCIFFFFIDLWTNSAAAITYEF